MNWTEAWIAAFWWGVLPLLVAVALALVRRAVPPVFASWLVALAALGKLLPIFLPIAAGLAYNSWKAFAATAVLAVPFWLIRALIDKQPFSDRSLPRELERLRQRGGYPSLSIGIVSQLNLEYAWSGGFIDTARQRAAGPNSLYCIGSITKIFTTSLLAILRDEGLVCLDDPVQEFLPVGTEMPTFPNGDRDITLRHLATHTSGLPRLPVDLQGEGEDPYEDYSAERLVAQLANTRLEAPIGSRISYSNLGLGLLGVALESVGGKPYEQLLRDRLLDPLEMRSTCLDPKGEDRAVGHDAKDPTKPVKDWRMGCLAPAGSLFSSVAEMAKFVALHLQAGLDLPAPIDGGTLAEMQRPHAMEKDWNSGVGLGWQLSRDSTNRLIVWHNGGTDGFTSFLGLCPEMQVGVIVLANCGREVDAIGEWLLQQAILRYGEKRETPPAPHLILMANRLSTYVVADPDDSLSALFDPSFLKEIALSDIQKSFKELYDSHGACKQTTVKASESANKVSVTFELADGAVRRAELEVNGATEARIVYLLFK